MTKPNEMPELLPSEKLDQMYENNSRPDTLKKEEFNIQEIWEELCLECGNKERGDLLNSKEKEDELWRYAHAIFSHFSKKTAKEHKPHCVRVFSKDTKHCTCGKTPTNLVPINEKEAVREFQDMWTYIENEHGASITTHFIYVELNKLIRSWCKTFGQKKQVVLPSAQELRSIKCMGIELSKDGNWYLTKGSAQYILDHLKEINK